MDALSKLSDRQIEILYLVGRDGFAWHEVAEVLSISPSTVRVHVSRIQKKFRCDRLPREAMTEIYWRHIVGGDSVD